MRLLGYTIVMLIAMAMAGCATTRERSGDIGEAPKALDVAMALKFEDIPVPTGFRVMTNESFTFQNDILRVGILKYSGRANVEQVVNFYKDQMPLYNWRFLNILEYGRRIMNFDREDQTCIVVIEATSFNVFVTITVAPRASRASTYKPVKEKEERKTR